MKQSNFKEFDLKDFLTKRNVDENEEKFLWPSIHHMRFHKGSMKMSFREKSFGEEPFRCVDLAKRNVKLFDLQRHELEQLYSSELKISGEKYSDLMDQLNFIPPCHHPFYTSLKHYPKKKKDQ